MGKAGPDTGDRSVMNVLLWIAFGLAVGTLVGGF
jgi:hypothetical protein